MRRLLWYPKLQGSEDTGRELMIFKENFTAKVKSNSKRFTLQNIISLPKNRVGIYIIHYRSFFVYVGKSGAGQGVRNRLKSHYDGTHSDLFKLWIHALDGNLMFTPIYCDEPQIGDLEKSAIRFLQPKANKQMYANYNPINKLLEY